MSIKASLMALALCFLVGCATVNLLPATPSEVDKFKTGEWPREKHIACIILKEEELGQVFQKAKFSLTSNGFKILKEDISKGVLIGEHGMTWFDLNVLVGIYANQIPQGIKVNVLAIGDADPRPIRLTKFDWHEKVLNSILSVSSSITETCAR